LEISHDPQVIFMPSGRRGRVAAGTAVLSAAQQLGVDIESLCGGRLTCNKCRVRLEAGSFPKHGLVSRAEHLTAVTPEESAHLAKLGYPDGRLACAARVQGDVLLYVPDESRGQKQIIRKSAGERTIDVAPAIRQVYVTVEPAEPGSAGVRPPSWRLGPLARRPGRPVADGRPDY
jgi:uncharacterized 2Fe-2S/4Fe-4S cluster protein (DUF4445 family)